MRSQITTALPNRTLVEELFFFNDTATTEIYTLSLHDALPIFRTGGQAGRLPARRSCGAGGGGACAPRGRLTRGVPYGDRESKRLNSSHAHISYAVFCFKKKTKLLTAVLQSHHFVSMLLLVATL